MNRVTGRRLRIRCRGDASLKLRAIQAGDDSAVMVVAGGTGMATRPPVGRIRGAGSDNIADEDAVAQ